MKKVKMILTSVIVLAIIGSAFAFKEKKIAAFCVTNAENGTNCYVIHPSKRTTGAGTALLYATNWDGAFCGAGSGCNTLGIFIHD